MLTTEKFLLQHFNFCNFTLWLPPWPWMPGADTPFAPSLHATGYSLMKLLRQITFIQCWQAQSENMTYPIEHEIYGTISSPVAKMGILPCF